MNHSALTRWIAPLLLVLLAGACKDKGPEPVDIRYENGVLLVNEGNFQSGNASLSFLGRDMDTVVNNVFQLETGRPLGDVAQSITVHGNRVYVVVNNSSKVEVLTLPFLTSACMMPLLQSPRYLQPFGWDGRALVTDLYANAVHIVDMDACAVLSSIPTGGWTEEMVPHVGGNRVFVTQTGTDQLLLIDAVYQPVIDSMYVGREPNSLALDRDGKLWVLCGSALGQVQPRLVRVNPDSMTVEASFVFPSTQDNPSKLVINAAGDRLYFINGGIYQMPITDGSLPAQAWIPKGSHNWYGLDIDPQTGHVYATDALDYQHSGFLYRFSPSSATPLASFAVGMIPGEMVFLP
jgi:DNA-binding beta-propeller fold protein YncE